MRSYCVFFLSRYIRRMQPSEIKAIRLNHSLTQAQLAGRLGYSTRQIVSFEKGQAIIPLVAELALAELERQLSYEYRAAAKGMHAVS